MFPSLSRFLTSPRRISPAVRPHNTFSKQVQADLTTLLNPKQEQEAPARLSCCVWAGPSVLDLLTEILIIKTSRIKREINLSDILNNLT
jgi:hypothetical protein